MCVELCGCTINRLNLCYFCCSLILSIFMTPSVGVIKRLKVTWGVMDRAMLRVSLRNWIENDTKFNWQWTEHIALRTDRRWERILLSGDRTKRRSVRRPLTMWTADLVKVARIFGEDHGMPMSKIGRLSAEMKMIGDNLTTNILGCWSKHINIT